MFVVQKKKSKKSKVTATSLLNSVQWIMDGLENVPGTLLDFKIKQPSQVYHSYQMQNILQMMSSHCCHQMI
jgi:hypothetical protein